jgi:dolichol-phosphate mannosyltransferase
LEGVAGLIENGGEAELCELDILIPVFNEHDNIVPVLETLRRDVQSSYRILICYDFDEDTTLAAISNYEFQDQLRIEYVKNKGRGAHAAVITGFEYSTAPGVLVFPADDIFNSGQVDKMIALQKGGADIVAPSRFIAGGCMKGCPLLKSVLVRISAWTLCHIARLPCHDPSNGFRMFSRRAITEIPIESTEGFTYSIELLVKAHRRGWRIAEVPAEWHERTGGQSRFRVLKWLPAYLRWACYPFLTLLSGGPRKNSAGVLDAPSQAPQQ